MDVRKLSDTVAELSMEKVAALLAERVAERVVEALMRAGFDKQFADSLMQVLQEQLREGK